MSISQKLINLRLHLIVFAFFSGTLNCSLHKVTKKSKHHIWHRKFINNHKINILNLNTMKCWKKDATNINIRANTSTWPCIGAIIMERSAWPAWCQIPQAAQLLQPTCMSDLLTGLSIHNYMYQAIVFLLFKFSTTRLQALAIATL